MGALQISRDFESKLDRLPLLGKRLSQMGVESKEKDMQLGFSILGFPT